MRSGLLIALLAACAAPPAPPPGARVLLPFALKEKLQAALQDRPVQLLGAHSIGGWTVERYRLSSGQEVLLNEDPSSSAVTLQRCVSKTERGIDLRAAMLALSSMEDLGARLSGRAFDNAVCLGLTLSAARFAKAPSKLLAAIQALSFRPDPRERARSNHQKLRAMLPKACERAGASKLVSIAGRFDRAAVLDALEGPQKTTAPVALPCSERSPRTGELRIPIDSDRREVLIAWPASHESRVPLEAITQILTASPDGQLTKSGLMKHVHSAQVSLQNHLELHMLLKPTATASVAAAAVDQALRSIAMGKTTLLQLERARRTIRARALRARMGLESRAQLAALTRLEQSSLDMLEAELIAIDQLSGRELQSAAQALRPQARLLVLGYTNTASVAQKEGAGS